MLGIINPVTAPIDRIINAFITLFKRIFVNTSSGFFRLLMETIMAEPLLYLGAILLLCGFVIGILRRMITL